MPMIIRPKIILLVLLETAFNQVYSDSSHLQMKYKREVPLKEGEGPNLQELPHLRVAVEQWVPHVKVDERESNDVVIHGPMANLINSLAQALNFRYTLVRPPDGAWGIPINGTNEWNGMIGMLKRNEADLALGPFGLTYSRSRVVDFSSPILIDYYKILVRRPQLETNPWRFTGPFQIEVWFSLLLSIFVITSMMILVWISKVEEKVPAEVQPRLKKSPDDYLLSVYGVTIMQPLTWGFKSMGGRIVVAVWWLTMVVMCKSYSSSLTSQLAVRNLNTKYDFLVDLVQDKEINLIFEKATALVEYFSKVKTGIYKDLADTSKEGRAYFMSSSALFDAAYDEVKTGQYALLVEDTTCRKIYSDDFTKFGKCNFYLGKERYWPLIFSIIGRKGLPIMADVNARLERILSHDLYFKWLSDEMPNATACLHASKTVTIREPYKLQGLMGVFLVFLGGIIIGLILLVLEYTLAKPQKTQAKEDED